MIYPIDLFEKQVREHPERTALICTDRKLTYAQLDEEAGKIAYALQQRGVQAGDLVMVMLPRNSSMLVSLLAVLKAGAGYIPVDLEYPKDRIEYIFENCRAKMIITEKDLPVSVSYETLCREGTGTAAACPDRDPKHICYMIYTSGTTGRPKGVPITQEAVVNYFAQVPENPSFYRYGNSYSCVLASVTVAFDMFEHEFLGTLLCGITLVFADEEESKNPYQLARLIQEYKTDLMFMTPVRLAQYLKTDVFSAAVSLHMKGIICAGEAFPLPLLKQLREISDADVFNIYGPSEITMGSHEKLLGEEITVGICRYGYFDKICDEQGNPVPDGEKGELYIGGVGVSPGYWGLDELNRTKFFEENSVRYFRSGDIAFRGKDGEIRIIGRKDNQIKLRGLRIELGEIESRMEEYGLISKAVVRVKKVRGADHLAAYYISSREIDREELKRFLAEKLVPYMIPDYYVRMDSFSLSPNGKVEARDLPEIVPDDLAMVPPRNEREQAVFARCAQIIGSEDFGVTDPLKTVGFSSLSLIDVASFVLESFRVELKLTEMMEDGCSVETICAAIAAATPSAEQIVCRRDGSYPMLPSQFPLAITSWRNQIFRKLSFPGRCDAKRLRRAVIRAVEASPYLMVRFEKENGVLMQRSSSLLPEEKDIPICPGIPGEIEDRAFFRMFHILDFPLHEFKIYEGDQGCILLIRMHHALFDHGCAKIFFDRILKAYDDPEAELCESVSSFDYLAAMVADREKLLAKSDSLMQEYTALAEIRPAPYVRDYAIAYRRVALPEFCKDVGNRMLAAVGKAVSEQLGMEKYLICHTFGGRNEAKYLHTMGYFPYQIPMLFDATQKDIPGYVSKELLRSIEHFSAWDDMAGQRLTEENNRLFVSFNYLENRGAEKDAAYRVEYPAFEGLPESEEYRKTLAHLDFNCFLKSGRGMITLSYDTQLFTAADAEEILKKAAEYVEAEL